ncbi:MAG: polyphenol oxidase family protein [Marmoricola sp.]
MHQVHGADVVVVNDLRPSSPPHCDALVTAQMGVALMARAADCVPVLIADPETGWIAAVHAGRPGLAQGVVPQAVAEMRSMGANPQVAWLGPHVCGACYEVPEQLQTDVVALVPQAKALTSWGTPSLDLGAGLHAQLAQDGVTDVRRVNICTRESQEWPSFRRDGERATRFAGVIWSHR